MDLIFIINLSVIWFYYNNNLVFILVSKDNNYFLKLIIT